MIAVTSDRAAVTGAGRGRLVRALLGFALVWSAALIVAGFVAPLYSSESASASSDTSSPGEVTVGEVSHGTATLVEVNGMNVLFVLAIPLLVAIGVAVALRWGAGASGSPPRDGVSAWGIGVAWVLSAALGTFTLLAMMSIGVFVLPVTAALIAAVWLAQRGRPAPPATGRPPASAG